MCFNKFLYPAIGMAGGSGAHPRQEIIHSQQATSRSQGIQSSGSDARPQDNFLGSNHANPPKGPMSGTEPEPAHNHSAPAAESTTSKALL